MSGSAARVPVPDAAGPAAVSPLTDFGSQKIGSTPEVGQQPVGGPEQAAPGVGGGSADTGLPVGPAIIPPRVLPPPKDVGVVPVDAEGDPVEGGQGDDALLAVDPTQQAVDDVRTMHDPNASAQEREQAQNRFVERSQLTAEQLAAQQRGEEAPVSPEQWAYMKAATGAVDVGFGGKSGMDAFEAFGDGASPEVKKKLQDALRNTLQALSNPKTVTTGVPPVRGGFDKLPKTFKSLGDTSESYAFDGNALYQGHLTVGTDYDRNLRIAQFLRHGGDDRYKSGTDLSRKLFEAGQHYLNLQTRFEHGHPSNGVLNNFGNSENVRRTNTLNKGGFGDEFSEAFFDAAAADKQAFAEAVNHPQTGSRLISNLLTHNWGNKATAANLFAFGPQWSSSPQQSAVKGRIMNKVARCLAFEGNRNLFLNIPKSNGKTVGDLNPELVRQLSSSLGPYIGVMVGDGSHMPGFEVPGQAEHDSWTSDPDNKPGDFDQLRNLFAVLNTDKEAGQRINGLVFTYVEAAQQAFGQNPTKTTLRGYESAGSLLGALDAGIDQLAGDKNLGDQFAAQRKGDTFDFVASGAKKFIGAFPGGGWVNDLINTTKLDKTLRDKFTAAGPPNAEAPDLNEARQYYAVLQGALQNKDFPAELKNELRDLLDEEGNLKPFHVVTQGHWHTEMRSVLEEWIGRNGKATGTWLGRFFETYNKARK